MCPITVVDDNSTDNGTVEFLKNLPESIKLIQHAEKDDTRHGGLYNNMQTAVEVSDEKDFILFIQDDMQIVRPLEEDDFEYIESYYSTFPKSAFLNQVNDHARLVAD